MRFLFVRPEVCPWVSRFPTSSFLQIPPHDGHPCFRLYPSHYRADSGLAPVRNVRRRAHKPENPGRRKIFLRPGFFTWSSALQPAAASSPIQSQHRYHGLLPRIRSERVKDSLSNAQHHAQIADLLNKRLRPVARFLRVAVLKPDLRMSQPQNSGRIRQKLCCLLACNRRIRIENAVSAAVDDARTAQGIDRFAVAVRKRIRIFTVLFRQFDSL